MKRLLCVLALLLAFTAIAVSAAPAAQYDADGRVAAITEPAEGILPLIYCRGDQDLTAAEVTWEAGHAGQGALLDGMGAYFRSDGTLLQQESLSFSLWVNWLDAAAAPTGQRLLTLRSGNRISPYMALSPNGGEHTEGLCLEMQAGAETVALTADVPMALTAGWHHLAVVWEGTALRLYLDGNLLDEKTAPINPTVFNPQQLCVGKGMRQGETGYFHGTVDEVLLYSRALTEQEVRDLAGVTGDATPMDPATPPADSPDQMAPTQPAADSPDPLQAVSRLWWLLIPVVAVAVLLACWRPWKRRRHRRGSRYKLH